MPARTFIIATAALAGSAALALPAAAATPEPGKMPLRAQVMFNLVDRNGDGAIDKDELDAVRNAIFAAIDADGDGKITKTEIQAIREGVRPRFDRRRPGPPGFRGPPRQGQFDHRGGPRGGRMGDLGLDRPPAFADLDRNGDGNLTQDEFLVGTLRLPGLLPE